MGLTLAFPPFRSSLKPKSNTVNSLLQSSCALLRFWRKRTLATFFKKEGKRMEEISLRKAFLFSSEGRRALERGDRQAATEMFQEAENYLQTISAKTAPKPVNKKEIGRWCKKAVDLVAELRPIERYFTVQANVALNNGKEKRADALLAHLSFLNRVSNRLVEMVRQLNTLL